MKNRVLAATTLFVGVSAILMFLLSVLFGISEALPFETRLWAGHESANSQSQILWVLAAAAGGAFIGMANLFGVFDRMSVQISRILATAVTGVGIDRLIILTLIAIVVLGIGSCATNIGVQILDRYVEPSCFYRSPC